MTMNFKGSCRLSDELKLSIFKCATCPSMLKPPVMLVEHIGNVCGSCFTRHNAPLMPKTILDSILNHFDPLMLIEHTGNVCGSSLEVPNAPFMRNTTLDLILNNVIVSCKNASYGCQEEVRYENLDVHMETCEFSPVSCLEQKCTWVGKKDTLPDHFYDYHKDCILENTDGNFQFNVNLETLTQYARLLVVHEEAVYFLTSFLLKDYIVYNLYQMDEAPKSTVTLRHQRLGTPVCETKTQIDVLPFDSFSAGTGRVIVTLLGLKSVLNLTKDVLVLLDFSYPNAIGPEIIHFIQCICCYDTMRRPIYQCSTGHSLCSGCLPELEKCPLCPGTFKGKIRNFGLEALAEKCDYQCKYKTEGCKKVCRGPAINDHEMHCPHQLYPCPADCGIKDCSQDDLRKHFKVSHDDVLCETDNFVFNFIFEQDLYVKCLRYLFVKNTVFCVYFYSKKEEELNRCFCKITIVCAQNKIKRFTYKVKLKSSKSARETCQTGILKNSRYEAKYVKLTTNDYWEFKETVTFIFQIEGH